MQDETVRFHLFCAQVVHRNQWVALLQGIVRQPIHLARIYGSLGGEWCPRGTANRV
jgi:hypothetical protein